jgi:plastocyanin
MVASSAKTIDTRDRIQLSRRAQRYEARKARARRRMLVVIGVVVLVTTVVVVVVSSASNDSAPTTTPYAGSTVDVTLGDYVILGNLTAPAGRVRLQAMNQGGIIHNVGIRGGPISGDMRPGKGFTIDLGQLAPGTYELYCDIVGHVERGMVANLVIT